MCALQLCDLICAKLQKEKTGYVLPGVGCSAREHDLLLASVGCQQGP